MPGIVVRQRRAFPYFSYISISILSTYRLHIIVTIYFKKSQLCTMHNFPETEKSAPLPLITSPSLSFLLALLASWRLESALSPPRQPRFPLRLARRRPLLQPLPPRQRVEAEDEQPDPHDQRQHRSPELRQMPDDLRRR